MRILQRAAAGIVLAACSGPTGSVVEVAQRGSLRPTPPSVATFDGTYTGTMRVLKDGASGCAFVAGARTLVVREGQARMVFRPAWGEVAEGRMREDGSFRMFGQTMARIEMSGQIQGNRVVATFESRNCILEFDGTRTA